MRTLTKNGPDYSPKGAAMADLQTQPLDSLAFDWVMITLSVVYVSGLYLDGWAHNHNKVDQSFFTVWHAFFYAGFGLVALLLTGTLVANRWRGRSWPTALPAGYSLSFLGILIFAAGGVGDLIWHELFGIEQNFDILLSPTHLMLGAGLALVVSGPLRAAWQRPGKKIGWRKLGPAILSLACLTAALTFFMMFSHPLMSNIGGRDHAHFNNEIGQIAGVVSILLMTGLVMGPTYLALHRWSLPPGALILVWGSNSIVMAIIDYEETGTIYLTLAMLAGIVLAELWRLQLKPSATNRNAWRLFAFGAPVLVFGAYFVALLYVEGSVWTIHMLTGTVILSGVVGWLLSYLIVPPAMPVE
ncbi:MAG: hypothetical protein NT075_13675 [Chloroflexi bacterium]|nr:hypothetical protein [Chloroflexota bacterium]